jgi:hypothetical protein
MTFEFDTIPDLPTYVKVPLTDNPIPCILNIRTVFKNQQDSIGATNTFYLSGSSKRPSENNNQHRYKNVITLCLNQYYSLIRLFTMIPLWRADKRSSNMIVSILQYTVTASARSQLTVNLNKV